MKYIFAIFLNFLTLAHTLLANEYAEDVAAHAPHSTLTLDWLDKVDSLDKEDIDRLRATEGQGSEISKSKIEQTISVYKSLHKYEKGDNAPAKREILKLALTAIPSIDVNQTEWRKRVAALGDAWLPYVDEMEEKNKDGFQMGIARMLSFGIGSSEWSKESKEKAVSKLLVYLHSDQEFSVLGVLMGIDEENIRELDNHVLFLLNGENDKLSLKATFVLNHLAQTGTVETAERLRAISKEMKLKQKPNSTQNQTIAAIEETIKQIESKTKTKP